MTQQICSVAGEEGFEPSHDGVKVRCLTTWLLPISAGQPVNYHGCRLPVKSMDCRCGYAEHAVERF
jgi:hypothetical protein